ncbi:MAG TPA: hypothetical protein VFX48_06960, partial [Saprospiraceae bacterium]|nr:hypothetical protein [Saprospiraceae bacterium]
TKPWYLLREIRYETGDRIVQEEVPEILEQITSDLKRTNLFITIDVLPVYHFEEEAQVKFVVRLEENWYIFPSVIFELADRNINEWWTEHDRSLKRINLGLAGEHVNFSGVRDVLKLKFHGGYTHKAELVYARPALSERSRFGVRAGLQYAEFKEVAVRTEGNKLVFVKDGKRVLFRKRELSTGLYYKANKFWNLDFGLSIQSNRFDSDYALEHPDFFLEGNNRQDFGSIYLQAGFRNIDHYLKPTRGMAIAWTIKKTGLPFLDDYRFLSFSQAFKSCNHVVGKMYLQTNIQAQLGLDRNKRPYNLYKSLGYSDSNISGYEYYVIDGLDHLYINEELRYYLTQFKFNFFRILKSEPIFRIRTEIDLAMQANLAYVNDPFYQEHNYLVNRWLYSTGAGLNFTVNGVIQLNVMYSVNHLKEGGLYFHTRKSF